MGIKRSVPGRSLIVSVLSLLLVGVVGNVSAQTATITNTGPDSVNKIISKNTDDCAVTNNNNIGIYNTNTQSASTGNASVSHNTTVSGWGEWDPGVWAAKGYSYDQWYAAFNGYMASHAADWKANWGSMSPSGGAVSGNASNISANTFKIGIDNSGACGITTGMPQQPGRGGAPETPATEAQKAAQSDRETAGRGTGVGLGGNTSAFMVGGSVQNGTQTGTGMPQQPAGGQGGNNQPTPHDPGTYQPVIEQATISNTGPDSINKIIYKNEETTTVTNNNNVNAVNVVTQTSTSGDAKVKDNTTAGGAGTGNGSNASANGVGVTITN